MMNAETRYALLNSISDDYKNVETIEESLRFQNVSSFITRSEIAKGLKQLIDEGLARAYMLSPHSSDSEEVEFDVAPFEQLWFYVTPKGKELVTARRAPFVLAVGVGPRSARKRC